jgi:flagellar hook assembly protein FlgD
LQRLLTTATLVGLLVATAAAFAITERLKLTKSAVYGTVISTRISPTCGCQYRRASIFFKLRRSDDITVTVLNSRRQDIALLTAQHYPRGPVTLTWNGRNDGNRRVRDGTYRVRIHLTGQHQTIEFPNRIQLDTKPPQVVSVQKNRDVFSPDQDHQADYVRITYALSKPAHLAVYLGSRRVLYSHVAAKGGIQWFGTGPDGTPLKPGAYTLSVGAVDLSGNSTPVDQRARVRVEIRYIRLANTKIVTRAGRAFEIGVSTDAKRYGWALGRRQGESSSHVLRLRAPTTKGRYTLTVSERGHVGRAAVFVR